MNRESWSGSRHPGLRTIQALAEAHPGRRGTQLEQIKSLVYFVDGEPIVVLAPRRSRSPGAEAARCDSQLPMVVRPKPTKSVSCSAPIPGVSEPLGSRISASSPTPLFKVG